MKKKRFFAYLIDLVIACLFVIGITILLQNDNTNYLQVEMNALNEQFLTKKVNFITYLNYYSMVLHDLDKQKLLINIMGTVFLAIYYIIIPYKNKGRTLGKMLMNIQIYKENGLSLNTLIGRSVIINGIAYMLISILLVMILPSFSYFLTISILGVLQIILVFVSCFMILYKKDGKGLEDILTSSYVRDYNEVKK